MAYDITTGVRSERDWSCGIDDESGSILFPEKEQDKLYSIIKREREAVMTKLDDVRYDVRNAKGLLGAGVFALAGALGFLGLGLIFKAGTGTRATAHHGA